MAREKYISLIVMDGPWEPDKSRGHVEIKQGLPGGVDGVYRDTYQMDDIGRLIPGRFISNNRKLDRPCEEDIHEIFWKGNFTDI